MTKEEKLIIETAKKYPDAFKLMDISLIDASFTTNATKTGFLFDYENGNWLDISTARIPEIKEWAANFNKEGIIPNTEVKINVLDMQDRTAVVKLEMDWLLDKKGCDYIFLVKEDKNWKIQTIVYQSII